MLNLLFFCQSLLKKITIKTHCSKENYVLGIYTIYKYPISGRTQYENILIPEYFDMTDTAHYVLYKFKVHILSSV